ncbi:MAG: competence/damage-inducible protein cinA [Chthonomonadaceae bacterium]|nr:competence/damage-inducible protein cinA [Chthonomonadaceae bacterium]
MGTSRSCEEFTLLRAEIVSVGTELLMGQIVDTNAAYMARGLAEVGISIYRRTTVGDNMERLVTALKEAFNDSDVVITIGGLGPTMDDITREGLATALGDTLVQDEQIAEGLRQFFSKRNMPVLESNLRQALVPVHGRAIANPNGTAPGVLFEKDGKIGIALPGPPNEFIPMTDNHVLPYLRQKTGNIGTIRSLVLRVAGVGESAAEDRIKDLMMDANPSVAPYAKVGEVHLRVTAKAETAELAEQMIAERAKLVRERLGEAVYGENDDPLEKAVVDLLKARGKTVSTAESCTGGLVAQRITDIAGSSAVFLGGVVAYSNAAKTDLVSVPSELIERVGAVSPEVAQALAEGARQRFGTDYGIGVTGVAGPDGGTLEKPVGLVYLAVAYPGGCEVDRGNFIGSRAVVRSRASQNVLNMLRLLILR